MPCSGTTWAGAVTDPAGKIRHVFCDPRRTIDVDSRTGGRRSWGITYLDPNVLRAAPAVRPKGGFSIA